MARSQAFIDSIIKAITNDLAGPQSRIHTLFANNIIGGWEGWLQVEAAAQIIADGNAATFAREAMYLAPGGGVMGAQKCDLMMLPARGIQIFIELKTQRYATYAKHVQDFIDDIDKIVGLGPDWNRTFPAIAMVCMQANQARFQQIYADINRKECDIWARRNDGSFGTGKLSAAVNMTWNNQFAIVAWANS